VNDARRPFVDRPVTDVDAAAGLADRLAGELGLRSPRLMRVGMNALFEAGDTVIRVGKPSADPHLSYELANRLTTAGIVVPQPATDRVVAADGMAATGWRRVDSIEASIDWIAVGAMVRAVHTLGRSVVPDGYPVPTPGSFPWWHFDSVLSDVAGEIDGVALASLREAVARHTGWDQFDQASTVVCHGDVHPGNVVMSAKGPVLLDWDLMCEAPAGWDHAMLVTLAERWGGDPAVYPAFAAGYGASLADDEVTRAFAELRNVAATLMRVRAARTNLEARAEAERRLKFWRNDPDAPQWQAQ
jgi:hypothetical protein